MPRCLQTTYNVYFGYGLKTPNLKIFSQLCLNLIERFFVD